MKRLYKEEKAGSETELKKFKSCPDSFKFLFILLFISCETFPQVFINGFCKYNSFVTDSGYTGIFAVNFNRDSYTDLVLYNPSRKQFLSLAGNQSGTLNEHQVYRTNLEISNITVITDRHSRITGHMFSSRKSLTAGIFEFLKDGRIKILKKIKFNSFPESIASADITNNGTNEMLVSGSAFDGLSIIKFIDDNFVEEKIAGGTSYSSSVFVDLNSDGYADIAAVNVNERTIDFFYNTSKGKFRKVRSFLIGNANTFLKAVDMNFDLFDDLVYSSGNSIEIMYGDPFSSFEEKAFIKTKYIPNKIVTGDFNRDGIIDIAYINVKEGIISLIFARDEKSFYPEIIYLKKEGIKDIIPYYSKFINGIAALSSSGRIYTITNLLSLSGEVDITIGVDPSAINYFDNGNNGIVDICFIDNYDSNLKFIIRNPGGIPATYYSYPLYEAHSEILVENTLADVKTFYCYSADKKLIEAVTADFRSHKFSRQSLYSPGTIKDLKLKRTENDFKIYSAYVKNKKLGLAVFSFHDFRYTLNDHFAIANDVSSVNLSLKNSDYLYYWQHNRKEIVYSRYSAAAKSSKEFIRASLPGGDVVSVTSFVGDLLNMETDVSISFLKGEKENHIVISSQQMTRILKANKIFDELKIPQEKDLFFGEVRMNGLKKLMFYSPASETIQRLDLISLGRSLITAKIADVQPIGRFFVKNMSFKKYHIVYTNKEENCITIKEI